MCPFAGAITGQPTCAGGFGSLPNVQDLRNPQGKSDQTPEPSVRSTLRAADLLVDYAAMRLSAMAAHIGQQGRIGNPAYAVHCEHGFADGYRCAAAFITSPTVPTCSVHHHPARRQRSPKKSETRPHVRERSGPVCDRSRVHGGDVRYVRLSDIWPDQRHASVSAM